MRVSFKNNDILCLGQLGVDRQFQDFFLFLQKKCKLPIHSLCKSARHTGKHKNISSISAAIFEGCGKSKVTIYSAKITADIRELFWSLHTGV